MLCYSRISQTGTSFINTISSIANRKPSMSLKEILEQPQLRVQSLSFIPPPRWAAELSRKIKKTFPELDLTHQTPQLQAFIHPSFLTYKEGSTTMRQFSPMGDSILIYIVCKWIFGTFEDLRREEANSLICLLTGDAALSRVVRDVWKLENMILTDASANLFTSQKIRSAKGLMKWLTSGEKGTIPDPFLAECLKAFVAVVYMEKGMNSALTFCSNHVFKFIE